MPDIKKEFEAAINAVTKANKDPGNDLKLKLYAHCKQATECDVKNDRPGFMEFVGGAIYDAWFKLNGMSEDAAKKAYIKLVEPLRGNGAVGHSGKTEVQGH